MVRALSCSAISPTRRPSADRVPSQSSISNLQSLNLQSIPRLPNYPLPNYAITISVMSHSPVRAGNLPAPVGPYSPGMGFDKLIFVPGQGGTDPTTGKIADDVEQQTEQCLKNVQAILEA